MSTQRLMQKLVSPVNAQQLVGGPPAEQAPAPPPRQGLAGYFAAQGSAYVKVFSHGQLGYLPRARLAEAQKVDPQLKIVE